MKKNLIVEFASKSKFGQFFIDDVQKGFVGVGVGVGVGVEGDRDKDKDRRQPDGQTLPEMGPSVEAERRQHRRRRRRRQCRLNDRISRFLGWKKNLK